MSKVTSENNNEATPKSSSAETSTESTTGVADEAHPQIGVGTSLRLEAQLATMTSPIRHVMRHLPAAIERIAPERRRALADMQLADDVTFNFTENPCFVCRYIPASTGSPSEPAAIEFSAGAMTVMWAFSHAYVTLYERVLPLWINGDGQLSLTADPVVRDAMALLWWAIQAWTNKEGSLDAWPTNLIKPLRDPVPRSPENVADELSLCAAAYAMHHEFAHHYLQHTPRANADNIQEEQDADLEAAHWILGAVPDENPSFFLKRSLGIATAILALLAKAVHRRRFDGVSHPREFDRLVHVLDRFVDEDAHRLWQFVCLALKLHLDAEGITTPNTIHESARACLEAYVDVLAEADRIWSAMDRGRSGS